MCARHVSSEIPTASKTMRTRPADRLAPTLLRVVGDGGRMRRRRSRRAAAYIRDTCQAASGVQSETGRAVRVSSGAPGRKVASALALCRPKLKRETCEASAQRAWPKKGCGCFLATARRLFLSLASQLVHQSSRQTTRALAPQHKEPAGDAASRGGPIN